MKLFNFTVKDNCPEVYTDKGSFKKSTKTPQEVLDKKIDEEYAKDLDKNKAFNMIAPHVSRHREGNIGDALSKPEGQLLQLKPNSANIDWSLFTTLTGTRPSVSKYSMSRYSQDEWRRNNAAVLNDERLVESNILQYSGQVIMRRAYSNVDKIQLNNNNRLKQRAKEIFRSKVEIELACKAMVKEVELLEIERQRIKSAIRVLMLPESISRECIEIRSSRAETDLVMDTAEQELIKEMELVSKVREMLKDALQKIEEQLAINRAAKDKIEYDWCDKTVAYSTEILNLSLNIKSNTFSFKPGATKFGSCTAPPSYWEYYSRKNIEDVEAVRQASSALRCSYNDILINNGKTLRQQADKTDIALAETAAFTFQLLTKMEDHLKKTLRSLAEIELMILNLHNSIRKMDTAMKLAQTRLDNRNSGRPHQENVRDEPHSGLLQEVKLIHESVASLLAQLNRAEKNRKSLIEKKRDLEINIASKKNTLNIDKERCGMIRSYFPTALELAGL